MICDMTEFLANLKLGRAQILTRQYSAFSQFTLWIHVSSLVWQELDAFAWFQEAKSRIFYRIESCHARWWQRWWPSQFKYVRAGDVESVTVIGSKGLIATHCYSYIFDLVKMELQEVCLFRNKVCATEKFPPLSPGD